MPELPEVENIRRTVGPPLVGQVVEAARVLEPRLPQNIGPGELAQQLVGRRFEALDRRAKYLLFRFSDGSGFVLHLRMTGQLLFLPDGGGDPAPDEAARRYVRMVLHLGRGRLELRDQRRFATLHWLEGGEFDAFPFLRRLGMEPLGEGFEPGRLAAQLRRRNAPIKSVLLNQECIAGLGNIYADEALFRAGIHPRKPASRLDGGEVARLHQAVVSVLEEALAKGGTSIRDYLNGAGEPGAFQKELQVYGREGRPCVRCAAPIRRLRLAGRSSWFCEECQAL